MDKIITLIIMGMVVGISVYLTTGGNFRRSVFFGIIGALAGGLVSEGVKMVLQYNTSPLIFAGLASGITSLVQGTKLFA